MVLSDNQLDSITRNNDCVKDKFKWQMRSFLARKVSSLVWGDSYIFQTEKENIKKVFRKFEKMNKLPNLFSFMERQLSLYGRCIVNITKTKSGDIMLNIPNPFYFQGVGKVFVQPQLAVIWQRFKIDTYNYVVKTTYDCHKMVNELFTFSNSKTVRVFDKEAEILKELQIEKEWVHNLGFVPVVEFTNLSFYQFHFNNNEFIELADWMPATIFEDAAYITLQNYMKEAINCHSRVLVSNASQDLMDKMSLMKSRYLDYDIDFDDFILETEMGGEFKPQPGIGDLTKYTQALDHILDFYFKFSGNSKFSEGGGAQKTVAETSTVRSALIESVTAKISIRQEQVKDLLKKVLCAYGVINDYWDYEDYFDFKINGNITKDETSFIDNQLKLVEAGAISMVDLIQKVFNVSQGEAEEMYQKTKEFNEANNITTSMDSVEFNDPEDHEEGNFSKETGMHISADKNGSV